MEALSGVEKKTSMGASLAEALIKIFGSPLLPWPGKNIRLASFATPGKDFLLIHKIVDVFTFRFRPRPQAYLTLYTVSWWIRKLSCIEEVPRFFFFIQFKIKFKNLNWLQLNLN